jgi:hypothetical protein
MWRCGECSLAITVALAVDECLPCVLQHLAPIFAQTNRNGSVDFARKATPVSAPSGAPAAEASTGAPGTAFTAGSEPVALSEDEVGGMSACCPSCGTDFPVAMPAAPEMADLQAGPMADPAAAPALPDEEGYGDGGFTYAGSRR